MAAFLQQTGEWPVRQQHAPGQRASTEQQGLPRPALPSVFCRRGFEEMAWTTFRQSVPDPTVLGGRRPGPWRGEFHCSVGACGGTRTAQSEPENVHSLWTRVPAPSCALPLCQCQRSALWPVLMHSPEDAWHAAWHCHSCGIRSRATAEQATDVRAWLLAAERLEHAPWQDAASQATAQGFWTSVRDRAAELVLYSLSGGMRNYFNAGPPEQFMARTNSQIFAPLLLDAAGLLSADAQAAWRRLDLASSAWDQWVQVLSAAPNEPLQVLVTALHEQRAGQPQSDDMSDDVCLLWESASRLAVPGSSISLAEIVRVSRTQNGYCPGLVQEVLLHVFGGPVLCGAVLQLAADLRAQAAQAAQNASANSAVANTAVLQRGNSIAPRTNGVTTPTVSGSV